jgi:hypothetical protein
MKANTITCKKCGAVIDITEALQHQLADELKKKEEVQNETLRKKYEDETTKKIEAAVKSALDTQNRQTESELTKLKTDLELERQKAKNDAENAANAERKKQEIETQRLLSQIKTEKESNKEFQEKMALLYEKLSKAEKDAETADLKAKELIREKEKSIREEAIKKANEDNYTKIREHEETIRKLNEQLNEAKQVAEQGSQQLQGEILELDLEESLNANFKFDIIKEVKKGEYGADVRQIINDLSIQNCGLILWECKNAKSWSDKWVDKLKDELISEKAQVGIIVWSSSNNSDDYRQLSENIWVVKRQYAVMLGAALRDAIVKISIVNRNNEGKDIKAELIYNYLTSGEFVNRIKAITDTYDKMQANLKKEKRQTQARWAEQEKLFENITANISGMSGDLKGIEGKEIIALPEFEEELV